MPRSTFITLPPQASEFKSHECKSQQPSYCTSKLSLSLVVSGWKRQTVDICSLAHRINRNQVTIHLLLLWKDADPTLPCNNQTARPHIPAAVIPQGRAGYPTAPMFFLSSCVFWSYPLPAPLKLLISNEIILVCKTEAVCDHTSPYSGAHTSTYYRNCLHWKAKIYLNLYFNTKQFESKKLSSCDRPNDMDCYYVFWRPLLKNF